jgi:lipopolysaccharide export system protein LptA
LANPVVRQFANTPQFKTLLQRSNGNPPARLLAITAAALALLVATNLPAQQPQITFAQPNSYHTISVSANRGSHWREGIYQVWHLTGNVRVNQGPLSAASSEAILWIEVESGQESQAKKILAYFEGDFELKLTNDQSKNNAGPQTIRDKSWFGRLFTVSDVQMNVQPTNVQNKPEIYKRATAAHENSSGGPVRLVQYLQDENTSASPLLISPQTGLIQPSSTQTLIQSNQVINAPLQNSPAFGVPASVPQTDVDFAPRFGSGGLNVRNLNSTNPGETITVGTGGVRVTIQSERLQNIPQLASEPNQPLTILADSFIAWQTKTGGNDRWELYLEGDVIFSFGQRTIFAERMYYDPNFNRGTILNTEMLTPIEDTEGLARIKADVIQQLDENNFRAYGAAVTTSQMGVPRYWLQSNALAIRRSQSVETDPNTGQPVFDPYSGAVQAEDNYVADSVNNAVYVGGVPLFYWPRITTNLDESTFYLRSVRIGNDDNFGFQFRTAWNLYQVLGLRNKPKNAVWLGRLDYLSERGIAYGTDFSNRANSFFGIPGDVETFSQSYYVPRDEGFDNLGFDRRFIVPEETFRGHLLMRHRHRFQSGLIFRAEAGWISDRNFLNQYLELHWDEYKDYTSGIWIEKNRYQQSLVLTANIRLNNFFTETENLPKLDHYLIGQSLLFDRLVYYSHSHAGYRRFRQITPPTNPVELSKFVFLDWETADADGVVAATRQEIDLPVQVGPVKVVPYALGEAAYWQEDLDGNDVFRGLGQVGVRTSLPMWRVDPTISSELFNLKGLAHKITFESEVLYADASKDFQNLPLYDQLDDNSQEAFRRRMFFNTFGLTVGDQLPAPVEERNFAARYGLQRSVTSPVTEIADDLAQVRFGMNNRWQTKRGLPGRERIIDWITFDIQAVYFPKANRDNFGADIGLMNYYFTWNIGDRLSILSDGFYDFFSQGLRTTAVGLLTSRPGVGNIYLGVRSIEGPISSNVLQAALAYRMSDRWGLRANSNYDFGPAGSIGQRFGIIYIGESFLWNLGLNYDVSRNNTGVIFGVEPRFLRRSNIFQLGGQSIGAASRQWLD